MSSVFLKAQWRHLAMLNYEVPAGSLDDLAPRGTEIDVFEGRTFVSMVGFEFADTRLLGVPIPFHRTFPEVNLRFYVRRRTADGWRRGVVFVKELVPKWAVAAVARWVYNENYQAVPMSCAIERASNGVVSAARYEWRFGGRKQCIDLVSTCDYRPLAEDSIEQFIAEHYWGYSRTRAGGTIEYEVRHPSWRIAQAAQTTFDCDVAALYGERFVDALAAQPSSAFLADGSAISVHRGIRMLAQERSQT